MMKSAINIMATWAWGSQEEASYCLANLFPLPPMHCLAALAMKALGIAIILGSCLNKAPVILNVVNNKSVSGVSMSTVYSETIMYGNSAFYSLLRGNPFTAYGETLILTIQSIIVSILFWIYAVPSVAMSQRFIGAVGFGIYLFVVFFVLKPEYYYMLLSVNLPVLIFSRGSQIYTFFKCKHTGTQSLITTSMNAAGSLIRVMTTIGEIGFDIPMLSGYLISVVLNFILIAQFMIYKRNTEEYLNSLKKTT